MCFLYLKSIKYKILPIAHKNIFLWGMGEVKNIKYMFKKALSGDLKIHAEQGLQEKNKTI